ncbi:LacI family DNA-binding transcriptional regulator [Bifidobacterium leontopitheci]|uniref:LacI family transcriptional regulator n=1 Tax=Bifidobacterium leontopitheci TaxID=2650774 RepID=A0A6I1GMN2_9BIFI|nr:LacI family DNA-binding transcriptional regulator [Bifidobacterium leontopitheci]KAB7790597.1 LacI family transcriptional regulator [Bifidobacterium leontopitheci]
MTTKKPTATTQRKPARPDTATAIVPTAKRSGTARTQTVAPAVPVSDSASPAAPASQPQPPQQQPSSITNVAAKANVSIATVSRVLSGKRTKDDDIARRVRAAAEELNYSVNYAASALRSDVTNTIGLVIPSATDSLSARLIDALEPPADHKSTATQNRQLLLGVGGEQRTQAQRLESLVARNVDGIIIVPADGVDLTQPLERFSPHTPIVQVGGRQRSFRTSMVGIDENAAMEMIVEHLARQGVRSAAYFAGKEVSFESAEMFAMFHTQMRAHRLVTDTAWNRFGEVSVERGYRCTRRMFVEERAAGIEPPQAVICADDMIALGVMVALQTMGVRVPQDVRVVGFNDSPLATTTMPQLTSVRPPFDQIAQEALRLIGLGAGRPAHVTLLPQLVVRGSTVG